MTIGVPPQKNQPWFINPGLRYGWSWLAQDHGKFEGKIMAKGGATERMMGC